MTRTEDAIAAGTFAIIDMMGLRFISINIYRKSGKEKEAIKMRTVAIKLARKLNGQSEQVLGIKLK